MLRLIINGTSAEVVSIYNTPFYDEDGIVIEETRTSEKILKYWDNIYRKRENKMKYEWDRDE